jgi:hypothetical protein
MPLEMQKLRGIELPEPYTRTYSLCGRKACIRHAVLMVRSPKAAARAYKRLGLGPPAPSRLRRAITTAGLSGTLRGVWWRTDMLDDPKWGIPNDALAWIATQNGVPKAAVWVGFCQLVWQHMEASGPTGPMASERSEEENA